MPHFNMLCYAMFCYYEGAGADFVMAGGMFASHYESGGEIVQINGKLFKQFYGNYTQLSSYACYDCIVMYFSRPLLVSDVINIPIPFHELDIIDLFLGCFCLGLFLF